MFAFSSKLFTLFRVIPSLLLAASFQIVSQLSQVCSHTNFLFEYCNLGNVLQQILRTDRAKQFIFRVSGGKNFENVSTQCQPWWHLCGFVVSAGLPKKSGYITAYFEI